jgi:hypothetical protein
MPTTVDAILVVTKLFDSVVKALRGQRREPKPDNVLPAIVLAMARYRARRTDSFALPVLGQDLAANRDQ